jgi:hypothetical protein
MNTWNTLQESYQPRVYNNTLATVKRQIQQVENPTPAVVICVETAHVDNASLLDYLASEVVLAEPEFRSTDSNIPIHKNCTDDNLHFRLPGGSRDYKDEGDENNNHDAIATANRRRWLATELDRFDMGTCDVHGHEGEDDDDVDADGNVEEESSQGDDGSMQDVED